MKQILASLALPCVCAGAAFAQPMWGGYGGHHGMGQGMGPGMMGGAPGYGMGGYGMGMMGGPGCATDNFAGLDLSADQRRQLAQIQSEAAKAHWQLMGKMHEQGHAMHGGGPLDENAARQAYQAMAEAHKSMFELGLDTRKRMEAVLTKEQRERLGRPAAPR